ncbi:Uncharacterised protein [Mycobacteroides abscessus subsp. massiliense]|nr:Uncharacterised protein [Mycobacteroides abscessus subsp. massiliense]
MRLPEFDEQLNPARRVDVVTGRLDDGGEFVPRKPGRLGDEFLLTARKVQIDGAPRDATVLQERIEARPRHTPASHQTSHAGDQGVPCRHRALPPKHVRC